MHHRGICVQTFRAALGALLPPQSLQCSRFGSLSELFPNNLRQEVQSQRQGTQLGALKPFQKAFFFLAEEKLNKLILPIFRATGASPFIPVPKCFSCLKSFPNIHLWLDPKAPAEVETHIKVL